MAAGDVIVLREDAGNVHKANVYDGTDDYVLHDAHAVARVAAGDTVGTYTAWIYLDNINSLQVILSAGDNNSLTEYLRIYVESGGFLKTELLFGAAAQFRVQEAIASITAKTWIHVAVVQNATRPTLYVNGSAVAMSDLAAVDLTAWYDELTGVDKFAIGVLETNATHLNDFKGAIGRTKYFALDLTAAEIMNDYLGADQTGDTARVAAIEAARVFDITMESDGTTDSGSGADNGTLTGDAFYAGEVSDWSYAVHANVTGHAAEVINTVIDGNKYVSLIKRGD